MFPNKFVLEGVKNL